MHRIVLVMSVIIFHLTSIESTKASKYELKLRRESFGEVTNDKVNHFGTLLPKLLSSFGDLRATLTSV